MPDSIIDTLRRRRGYLSTAELIEILRVCRKTITRWTSSGKLRAIRVGNANRYDPVEIADWLEKRQIGLAV